MACRVLATGLSGFVGTHLATAIADVLPDAELRPLGCDITDAPAVDRHAADIAPDICLHLAAIAAIGIARENPDHAWDVNLHGTLNLAAALMQHAPGCPLIFISSADAYGLSFKPGTPLTEDAPLAPLNVYGATKAAADLALGAMAQNGLHVIRLRAFNHIGPGQSPDFAIAAFARQIARIEAGLQPPVIQTGNLDASRDFLDVRDVTRAYALVLDRWHSLPSGSILNIASGTSRRIGDVLDALVALSGTAARIETEAARMRAMDIPRAVGNGDRARQALGWEPRIPFEQTLADILADWRHRVGHTAA